RSTANAIRPQPWQTDTCIGDWHYSRAVYDENRYQTVARIVSTLTDVVSKNGNLMLNIPLRGDGSIDDKEEAFIAGFTAWMDVNSEGISATRPWKIYGEGPSTTAPPPRAYGPPGPAYTAEDIRFTQKGDAVYAFVGAWPKSRIAKIKSLASNSPQVVGAKVTNISLLGYSGKLTWTQDAEGLSVNLPDAPPTKEAVTLKIHGLPMA
ncbi:MAG: alpha-L-fucosidase, partial [Acidobacteriota bacterium]|nr:alpha-L-fucosidase [Acidobacteriota bacterium]